MSNPRPPHRSARIQLKTITAIPGLVVKRPIYFRMERQQDKSYLLSWKEVRIYALYLPIDFGNMTPEEMMGEMIATWFLDLSKEEWRLCPALKQDLNLMREFLAI